MLAHLPNFLIAPLVTLFVPAIAGYLAHIAFDYVDDVQKWTDSLPADVKRLVVAALCTGLVAINQRYGLSLPTDGSALTEPGIQTVIASAIAFFLKHEDQAASPKV